MSNPLVVTEESSTQAAQVLRGLALNEKVKARTLADPVLGRIVRRVARRYVAGESLADAVEQAAQIMVAGHRASVEYMGGSCRDPEQAIAETDVFVEAARRLPPGCSVSLALSHIGLAIDEDLAFGNALRIAQVTAETGREMVISAEGSVLTDAVLSVHRKLCERFGHVGITVQARLYRTADDLPALLALPGRIRLVKGAFPESETIACSPGDPALPAAYLRHAESLADSGHLCSFATHDWDLIHRIDQHLGGGGHDDAPWEFETLLGCGPDRLAAMAERGHPTREYAVFGTEWWLYVCMMLADDPQRLLQALIDAACPELSPTEAM
ncbi:proline dehydrogenase family protein [Nonomuraea sp. NPDC050202]|uniref:proline dehydrogenase family protein n=1 Tax=Nonomuraea sp. NPDC050202 TaxID=3155035 RepID=UPI0033EFD467